MSASSATKIIEPSTKLRPGESWQNLYVAKEAGSPELEFKVGETRQAPDQRRASMGGQTDSVFNMLAVFLTLNSKLAERLAFKELDKRGLRKYPGTRKELFLGEYEELCSVCSWSAAEANRLIRADALRSAIALPSVPATRQLAHGKPFWAEALRAPLTVGKESMALAELLARALTDRKLISRVERMGFTCVSRMGAKVDFEVNWQKAATVLNWLQARGFTSPVQFTPIVQFNVLEACPPA